MTVNNVKKNKHLSVVAKRHPIFSGVEESVLQHMHSHGRERVYFPGEEIAREEHPAEACFLVETGSVRIFSASEDGIEVTHQVLRAPAVFGVSECLNGLEYSHTAEPLEKTTVRAVPREVLQEATQRSHALACNLLRDVSARLCVATHRQKTTALYTVAPQLAHILITYADSFGLPVADGIQIRIPLGQHDLANTLGVAPRSVARALKVWMDEGTLTKRGRHFVVCNPARLAQAASNGKALPMVYSSDVALNAWEPRSEEPVPVPVPRRRAAVH